MAVENWLDDPTATCFGKVLNPTRHESVRKDVFVPSPHKNSFLFIRGIFYLFMEIKKDETLSGWFKEARSQEYSFPLAMCHGIQIAMKELNMSFAEVFELFVKKAIIIQVGKMFIYDLRGHKALVPKGLNKCEQCGEYKGEVMEKDLNWEGSFHKERAEKSEEYLGVSCLCEGILCPKCKKNKIHRPISNSYDPETNQIWHYAYFTGMMSCSECRER